MVVYLYRCGRNLNRAYRTCAAFGVESIGLIDCDTAYLRGNLFSASGAVSLEHCREFPAANGLLMVETWCKTPIDQVDWSKCNAILLGGETHGVPRTVPAEQYAVIPTLTRLPLTVEAALAIVLYEWRRNTSDYISTRCREIR